MNARTHLGRSGTYNNWIHSCLNYVQEWDKNWRAAAVNETFISNPNQSFPEFQSRSGKWIWQIFGLIHIPDNAQILWICLTAGVNYITRFCKDPPITVWQMLQNIVNCPIFIVTLRKVEKWSWINICDQIKHQNLITSRGSPLPMPMKFVPHLSLCLLVILQTLRHSDTHIQTHRVTTIPAVPLQSYVAVIKTFKKLFKSVNIS